MYAKRLNVLLSYDNCTKRLKGLKNMVENMPKQRVTISLPRELVEWLDKKIEKRVYANRSHAIEVLILSVKVKEKRERV